jgi:hypothetical protein
MPDKNLTTVVSSTSAMELDLGDWKDRAYDKPPDNHPIYGFVGRVCVEWASLEHCLDRLIWSLGYTISSRGACITSQLMGATARYKVLLAQLHLRAFSEPEFGKYAQRVRSLMTASYEPQEKRNRIVHDAWYIDTIHDEPGQFRAFPHKNLTFGINEVDLTEIEQTITSIQKLTKKAEELFDEINADVARHIASQKSPR